MATQLPASERRRQLLAVALDVFAANGFHQTAMTDIAVAAGVTKPVLYQHFASKRALFLAVLEDVGERMLATITAATGRAGSPHEQVTAGFVAYFRFVRDQESAFRVLFGDGTRSDPEFAAAVHRFEDTVADTIAPLIDAPVSDEHRRVLAHGIVGLGEVVGRYWLGSGRSEDADDLADRVAELAWSGLRGIRPIPPG